MSTAAEQVVLSLTDAEVTELAQHALTIEDHYGRPMDIEWARDGHDGQLYILQARPETVKSRQSAGRVHRYKLTETGGRCSSRVAPSVRRWALVRCGS